MMIKTLRSFILLFAFLVMGLSLQGQNPVPALDWVKTFGGTGYDMIWSSKFDPQGNLINVGSFYDAVDFDPGPAVHTLYADSGVFNMYIQKLDVSGNFLWAKSLPNPDRQNALNVAIEKDGSIYITGFFAGDSVDVDPDPYQTYYLKRGHFGGALYILKLDSLGNLKWAVAQSGTDIASRDIQLDTLGNLYVLGNFSDTIDRYPDPNLYGSLAPQVVGKNDFFIEKLDTSGNQVWLKAIIGNQDKFGTALALNSKQEPVVTGYYKGTVDFDPSSVTYLFLTNPQSSGFRGFIMSLNDSGHFKWVYSLQGTASSQIEEVQIDQDDDLYIAGTHKPGVDFDPGPGVVQRPNVNSGWFVEKLDTNGVMQWLHPYSNGIVHQVRPIHLILDQQKNVYLGAYSDGSLYLNWNKSGNQLQGGGSVSNIFVAEHNPNGTVKWGHLFGNPGGGRCLNLLLDQNQNLCLTGNYVHSIGFNPYNPSFLTPNKGSWDGFVLKFKSCVPSYAVDNEIIYSCGSFNIGGRKFYNDTTFMDTLQSVSGCDSIVKNWTLNIRHNPKKVKTGGGKLRWAYQGSDKNNYRFNWYDCDHDSIIPNETDSVFAPSHNGTYALIVSIFYCSDTSACYSINDVGLADLNPLQSLTVYPNPVENRLQISKADEEGYELTLLDITNRQLMKVDHTNFIDLKLLPAGTYFLKIEKGRWATMKKVIKN